MHSEKLGKILQKDWEYDISRNIPIWHNELTLVYAKRGFGKFQLPAHYMLRTHRGFHSDFYDAAKGESGRKQFTRILEEKLAEPKYIKFLKQKYKENAKKLIQMAKHLSLNHNKLAEFFDFYGMCLCMLDLTARSSKMLTAKVLELLKDYENKEEIIAYYTKPKKLVPIQKLERDLDKVYGKKINVEKYAKKLHKKYAWIPVSFVGEPWDVNYFAERIKNHKPKKSSKAIKPKEKLAKEAIYYLNALSEIAYLNEFRKTAFSQVSLIIRPVLGKIAKEHGLESWKELSLLTHIEILDLAKGKEHCQKELSKKRKGLCAMYNDTIDSVDFIYGEDVRIFEEKFGIKTKDVKEFKGVIANKGRIIGTAKIIHSPDDFYKFNQGDILIAKMTSVEYIPIMKKAAAFVTDEGGLACHAAIVSREFKIPCIIGTKIATKVLKDGDLAEVDANHGVVRIIK